MAKGILGHTQRRSVQQDKLVERVARIAAQSARDKYQEIIDAKDAQIADMAEEIVALQKQIAGEK